MDCDSNEEGNGDGKEGGRQVTAIAMKRALAMATRVAGNKESSGIGGKGIGDGDKGGSQATATRAVVTRVASEQQQ